MNEMNRWADEHKKEQAIQSQLSMIEYRLVMAASFIASCGELSPFRLAELKELVDQRTKMHEALLDQMRVTTDVMREERLAFESVRRNLEEMADVH